MTPADRKKKNDVIRYMCPITLWSVDDSHPASTEPFRCERGTTAGDGARPSVVKCPLLRP
jgi:hypothetical protein